MPFAVLGQGDYKVRPKDIKLTMSAGFQAPNFAACRAGACPLP